MAMSSEMLRTIFLWARLRGNAPWSWLWAAHVYPQFQIQRWGFACVNRRRRWILNSSASVDTLKSAWMTSLTTVEWGVGRTLLISQVATFGLLAMAYQTATHKLLRIWRLFQDTFTYSFIFLLCWYQPIFEIVSALGSANPYGWQNSGRCIGGRFHTTFSSSMCIQGWSAHASDDTVDGERMAQDRWNNHDAFFETLYRPYLKGSVIFWSIATQLLFPTMT